MYGAILLTFLFPSRQVPLNGLTPESLGMILRVQGISDMSIERLLEQTVQVQLSVLLTLLASLNKSTNTDRADVQEVLSLLALLALLRLY